MKPKEKLEKLKEALIQGGPCLIAYSGGVDSSFLLHVAVEVLKDRALALTAVSPSMPEKALKEAISFCKFLSVEHILVNSNEVNNPSYAQNPHNRCFYCKDELFRICDEFSSKRGVDLIYDGTNLDDLGEHRPGLEAAKKYGIRSPLVEAGLTKEEIRVFSKEMGIAGWDKPASPCLSSRFPAGISITPERLKQVEKLEEYLYDLGFAECRVRFYEGMAKIELNRDLIYKAVTSPLREKIVSRASELGFQQVTIDPQGYRRGSLTEQLVKID